MDDIVKAALKKWPKVPHCQAWLGLDARGDWYMRDERTQAAGPFPQSRGSRIEHEKLRQFIERNYAADEAGCWYFQNGPQRVYVELEAAPWVWRLQRGEAGLVVHTHTGMPASIAQAMTDEHVRVFAVGPQGFGLVHSLDIEAAADAISGGEWPLSEVRAADLPARFGHVLSPAAHFATARA